MSAGHGSGASGSRRRPGRPARLSRELVLRAALAIADEGGMDGVTMQRVARALGAEPMSLYRHVEHKEDLLDGLVDLVFAEIWVPSPTDPWQQGVRRRAVAAREVLLRHPWAVGLLESRAHPGPENLAHHDAVVANLIEAGFTAANATHAYNIVDSYVFGFAIQELSLPIASSQDLSTVAPEMLAAFPAGRYPHLEAVAAELVAAGFRYADEFEYGLDLVIDTIERNVPRG